MRFFATREKNEGMKAFVIALFILIPMTLKAEFSVDGTEYLTAPQKALLEEGIRTMEWPSYCPNTLDLFKRKVLNPDPLTQSPDNLVVDKSRRLLHLLVRDQVIASYVIALGGAPVGDKEREGDNKTPEGRYFIELKNPKSAFLLSLRINYPNMQDLEEARRKKIKDPGKDIMIHGLPTNWFKRRMIKHPEDWTRGCAAVTDSEITDIYNHVDIGTYIELCP